MSFTIAVSGKGGTGKTTLAGMIIRFLLDRGKGPILAVDADSNSNLNEVLGVQIRSTIGDAREMMKKEVPVGMTKDIWFEYKVQESLTEAKGFDLVAMGRPEGPGCYCAANTLARKCLDLLTGNYQYIVIDNEAGMEHFSRLTTRDVDLLFIVSDSSQRGILTASRIRDLIHELDLRIVHEVLVINRVQGEPGHEIYQEVKKQNLELGGILPVDEEVYRYDSEGKPTFHLPLEAKAVQAARRIFEKYIQ
ncbi:MAG: carbon monoxide dehydrogenase [Deltaproteobacteria bacterium RBG_16_47_11]|nr:MAG: carbon monoxide dehydrogenase [Deltaproteobacteria bacterium RBG_16_47_11]